MEFDYIGHNPRIICLAPDMVEIVYALGMGDFIVGWSSYTDYPLEVRQRDGFKSYKAYYDIEASEIDIEEELSHEVATVSKFFDCNYKLIEKLNPSIILGSESGQKPLIDELKSRGFEAYLFDYSCLDDVFDGIISIGTKLKQRERALELVEGYKKEIDNIRSKTKSLPKKKVYFEIAHQTSSPEYGVFGPYTIASHSPLTEMIEIAAGKNIYDDMDGCYIATTFDDIVARNPEFIMSPNWDGAMKNEITTLEEIKGRVSFDKVDAVKNDKVMYYDSSLMKRFGPRTIIAIKKLCYILHPEEFEDPKDSHFAWEMQ